MSKRKKEYDKRKNERKDVLNCTNVRKIVLKEGRKAK